MVLRLRRYALSVTRGQRLRLHRLFLLVLRVFQSLLFYLLVFLSTLGVVLCLTDCYFLCFLFLLGGRFFLVRLGVRVFVCRCLAIFVFRVVWGCGCFCGCCLHGILCHRWLVFLYRRGLHCLVLVRMCGRFVLVRLRCRIESLRLFCRLELVRLLAT